MNAKKIISAYSFIDEATKEEFALHVVHFPNNPARIVFDIMGERDENGNVAPPRSIVLDLSDWQAKEIATVLSQN